MPTFLSKYATAAHLAMMTVAPLFLFPFCGEAEIAKVLLWLSLLSAAWVIMQPSVIHGERPHEARVRFALATVKDPVFWASLLLVAYSGVRALNGGIAFAYDAENAVWSISEPALAIMPGCVDGAGFLPFAACVALLVLLQGIRHGLDAKAVTAFFTFASVFSGISALVAACAISYGGGSMADLVKCAYIDPSFAGTAYGLHLIGGIVALFSCAERRRFGAEFLTAIGVVATSIGLVLFSPALNLVAFSSVLIVFVAILIVIHRRTFSGAGGLGCTLAILFMAFVAIVPFLLCDNGSYLAARRDDLLSFKILPSGFCDVRAALSGIALKVWKSGPWLGSGLGSFPLDIKFVASQSDWAVVSPLQKASINGLWQLLGERGVVGVLVYAIMLGFLLWTYVRRLFQAGAIRAIRGLRDGAIVFPIVLILLVGLSFFDCSFMRIDVLLASASAMALSAAAIPARRCADSNIEEVV